MKIAEEILDEILTRLPVKSLVRFKVVCKEWYYNIQSSFFIAKHTNHQTRNKKPLIYHKQPGRLNFVVSLCSEQESKDEDDDSPTLFHQDQQYYIKEMPLDYSRYCIDNNDDEVNDLHNLNHYMHYMPHFHKPNHIRIRHMPPHYVPYYSEDVLLAHTCNGLVCLDYTNRNADLSVYNRIITIWNPATRDFKTIPPWEPQPPPPGISFFELRNLRACDHIAFGFDSTSNDYKVIRVIHCYSISNKFVNQAMIYSLNTNSWRELDYSNVSAEILGLSYRGGSTIFLCEKVYWLILSCGRVLNSVQLSFDMGKEVFQLTPLPPEFKSLAKQFGDPSTEFFTFHDSIALVLHGRKQATEKKLQIWTTKELEQGRASWSKVLNIDHVTGIARPLGFWNCKRSSDYLFLFTHYNYGKSESDRNLNAMKGIYINDRGEIKDERIMTIKVENNIVFPLKVVSYVETLVPVNRP